MVCRHAYRGEFRRLSLLLGGYAQRSRDGVRGLVGHPMQGALSKARERAGLSDRSGTRILSGIILSVLTSICLGGVTKQPMWALLAILIPGISSLWLRAQIFKRVELFERDYTALLLALASSVRTGLDPLTALLRCGELFDVGSEVQKEIVKLRHRIELGASEDDAIRAFARTIAHPDLTLFRTAFLLSRQHGSSLGECLHRLARVTRQRQAFRRKIRSSVAMQKMSAVGIGGCAIVIGLFQIITNPEAVHEALLHPGGEAALTVGAGLMVMGLGWMFRLTQQKV